MTNQAAQTMPETLKTIADNIDRLAFSLPAPNSVTPELVGQAIHLRKFAAALSQPAGVPEGWKLVPVIPTEEMIARGDEIIDEDGKRVRPESIYDAMVSGAPAASGGECHKPCTPIDFFNGDACQDCVTRDYSPRPPSAASVSERAREFLADEYDRDGQLDAVILVRENSPLVQAEIRAIERALSSPRQEGEVVLPKLAPAGHVSREELADYIHGWLTKLAPKEYGSLSLLKEDLYVMVGGMVKLYTHPSTAASTQGLRELVQRWRDKSQLPPLPDAAYAQARVCARELESLLGRGGHG